MDTYSKKYTVDEKHIDAQGIVDGLYYPFYMEDCRHKYVSEILQFDIEKKSKEGINMVLSEYTLRFRRSLKQGDAFDVTCTAYREEGKRTKIFFEQTIHVNGTVFTEALFTATCIPVSGGRPFIPDSISQILPARPPQA